MYAHVLRKWSLAKYLIIQWLPVLMLLVLYWCQGAAGLHLKSSSLPTVSLHVTNVTTSTSAIDNLYRKYNDIDYLIDRLDTIDLTNINNNDKHPSIFKNQRNINLDNTIFINRQFLSTKISENLLLKNKKKLNNHHYRHNILPTHLSIRFQRKMRSRETHDQTKRNTKDDNNKKDEIYRRIQRSLSPIILSNNNENKQSLHEQHGTTKTESGSEPFWPSRRTLQQFNEKRARTEAHHLELQNKYNIHQLAVNNKTIINNIRHHQLSPSNYNYRLAINNYHPQIKSMHKSFRNRILNGRNRRESRHDMIARHLHQPIAPRINKRRFCSARDPTTLAFEAPTVFEGKVRSMSSDRRRNFSVTFEVKEVYKRQLGYKLPFLLRLQFSYRNNSECDIYKETMRFRGFVRDELEQGKVYILFVQQIDLGNFTILGQPIKKTRKVVNEVKMGASEKYGQRASIESLLANYSNARVGRRIRIVCKVRGQPPPKVTWFKDGRSIGRNRSKYQFIHLRKRAELIVKSATKNDSGQYECRAKNKLARQPVTRAIRIEVLPKEEVLQPNNWTHLGSPCPVIGNAFCLNGGTCVFFKDVGEPACKCPDGFLGNRCETKNPTNLQPSTYNKKEQQQCGDNKFYGSYYC